MSTRTPTATLSPRAHESHVRRSLAGRLIGRDLRWAHLPDGPLVRVEAVSDSGLVTISGYVGEFAPDLFTIVEDDDRKAILQTSDRVRRLKAARRPRGKVRP